MSNTKNMSYRELYEYTTKEKIPAGYEIHHTDLDRENNNFYNLVMLPIKLHQEYHRLLMLYRPHQDKEIMIKLRSVAEGGNGVNSFILNEKIRIETEFIKVWNECSKWLDYKFYKLGTMPNIHNIEI